MRLTIQIFFCILVAGITLFAYIDKQNGIVELRLAIPVLDNEIKAVQEENTRLKYEIERFESPIHLMELARKPEFSHLRYPQMSHVTVLTEPSLEDAKP